MEQALTMRLDNASNIYPASLTKRYASIFRMSVTLFENVDAKVLQEALENTVRRIPSFGCTLKNGVFWWYLCSLDKKPVVSRYSPMGIRGFRFHGGFLFKAMADGNRIVLDVFHAIADGRGGQTFLLTLTGEYLRLRHGISISYNSLVLNTAEKPSEAESADCFRNFSGKKGSLEQNDIAFHIKGRKLSIESLLCERIEFSSDEIRKVLQGTSYTVTDFVAAAMLEALQEEHRLDKRFRKRNSLKVNIPVDLRKLFEGKTLRNYSSYVNVGVDVSNGYFSFDELLNIVSAQKTMMTLPSELEKKIAANVALEDNMAIAMIPRFIKRIAIDTICRLKGDRFNSYTFSNLGRVILPEQMQPYVSSMDFVLGRKRGTSGAAACVGYNGKIVINLSRNIAESRFERNFAEVLRRHSIEVKEESFRLA